MKRDEFKRLQAEWYARLRDEGFVDIEGGKDGFDVLLRRRGPKGRPSIEREQQEEFFRLAGLFLHDHEWVDGEERRAWELYCDGKTYPQIAETLEVSWGKAHYLIQRVLKGPFKRYRGVSS